MTSQAAPSKVRAAHRDAATKSIPEPRTAWRRALPLALVLLGVTAAVYARVHAFDFIHYDDPGYVENCQEMKQGLSLQGVRWAITGVHLGNWHPLTTLTYLTEYHFFGRNPRPYHITNVVLHVLATLALLAALIRLTDAPYVSLIVAALFALHPLHVQSVAWISERKDVLSGLFFMLTLWAYAGFVRTPRARTYAAVLAFYALALVSKPMVVTLPFVLLLLDVWPLGRVSIRGRVPWHTIAPPPLPAAPVARLLMEKAPLILMAAASCIVTLIAQRRAMSTLENVPVQIRLSNSLLGYGAYLAKMIWPTSLSAIYPLSGRVGAWPVAATVLLLLTALVLIQPKRRAYLWVGWLWFLGMLIPVIGLVQVGDQAYADRYTYLPLIGPFLALAWLVSEHVDAHPRWLKAVAGATVVLLVALTVRTWVEIGYWKDTDTLFTRASVVVPNNSKAQLVLGMSHYRRGDLPGCIRYCLEAVRMQPNYSEAYNRLGVAYVACDDYAAAEMAFTQVLQLLTADAPNRESLMRDTRYCEARYNMGLFCMKMGRLAEAESHFRERLAAQPDDPKSHSAMAALFNTQGKPDAAAQEATAALAIDPTHAPALYNLAVALIAQGRADEAIPKLHAVLKQDALDIDANTQLGEVLLRKGMLIESAACFQAVLKRLPDDPVMHLKLGAVLQSLGRLQEAIEHYRKALAVNPQSAARNNLAWLLATAPQGELRNGAEAIRLAEKLNREGTVRPEVLDTLAAAYAETGDFTKAVATAQAGIALAKEKSNTPLASEIERHLSFYRQQKPYRDEPPPPPAR